VDEDVELAELSHSSLNDLLPIRLVGDVEMVETGRAVGGDDLRRDLLAVIVELIGDDDLTALAGEDFGGAGAHPRRAAGDGRDLAFQAHGFLPLCLSPPRRPGRRAAAPSLALDPAFAGVTRHTVLRQFTPTASPIVSPIASWITRSAARSSPVSSRLTMTSCA